MIWDHPINQIASLVTVHIWVWGIYCDLFYADKVDDFGFNFKAQEEHIPVIKKSA